MLIIDEISMVDILLAANFVEALRVGGHVVMVGDPEQLPAVGPGAVLRDMIDCQVIPRFHLTETFRQDPNSNLLDLFAAVLAQRPIALIDQDGASLYPDIQIRDFTGPHANQRMVEWAVQKFGEVRDPNRMKFLAYTRGKKQEAPGQKLHMSEKPQKIFMDASVGHLNEEIVSSQSPLLTGEEVYKTGDKVYRAGQRCLWLTNTNDETFDMTNGREFDITRIWRDKETDAIWMEITCRNAYGQPIMYEFQATLWDGDFMHGYSLTIHKCIAQYERVSTTRGLIPIGDLRVGDRVYTGQGERHAVTGIFPVETKPVTRITTRYGYRLDASAEHPILAALPDKDPEFVRAADITPDHRICITREHVQRTREPKIQNIDSGSYMKTAIIPRLPSRLAPYLAWLLGVIVGDGSYVDKRDGTIEITNMDTEVFTRSKHLLQGFGLHVGTYRPIGNAALRIYTSSRPFRDWLRALGMDFVTAHDKHVPWIIFAGSSESRAAFLQGLFDTDGSVSARIHSVRLSTSSDRLAHDVLRLLLSLGIVANCRQWLPYSWHVTISGTALPLFAEQVGFSILSKLDTLSGVVNGMRVKGKTNVDTLPNGEQMVNDVRDAVYRHDGRDPRRERKLGMHFTEGALMNSILARRKRVSYHHLERLSHALQEAGVPVPERVQNALARRYFYDPVETIEHLAEEVPMYDIEVQGHHSFAASGFVCHNSQGSEYDEVCFFLRAGDEYRLDREAVYTALTRAKKTLYIVGDVDVIWMVQPSTPYRKTGLVQKLKACITPMAKNATAAD